MGENETGKLDELKGRVKEAAGSLLDDDDLKRSGQADQAAGKAKEKAGEVIDTAKEKLTGAGDSKSKQKS